MKFPHCVRSGGASLLIALSLLPLQPLRAQLPAPKTTPAADARPPQATAAAAEKSPSVTFDTLLSADAYGIYAELRAVGQHGGSQEIAQLLAPFKLESSGTPDELLELYEFIRSHSDELMTSRLMFATMPARDGVPDTLLAVEMPSVEEARKFVPELRQFVAANIAPPSVSTATPTVTTSAPVETSDNNTTTRRRGRRRTRATAANAADGARAKRPAPPQFQIKRAGNLIALSNVNFTFQSLQGKDQALLVNEPGFQTARARFSTDTLFVYFNTVRMNNSATRRMEAQEKEWRRQEEELAKQRSRNGEKSGQANVNTSYQDEVARISGEMGIRPDGNGNFSATMNGNMHTTNANVATLPEDDVLTTVTMPPAPLDSTPEPTPSPMSEKELEEERQRERSQQFAQTLGSFVFGGRGAGGESWPDSIGVGASLAADALVLRGLFISPSADQPLRPIPLFPVLLSGPSIAAEASAVLPADTDIFLSVSLDLPQMYDYLASLMKIADLAPMQEDGQGKFGEQLTAFEKTNNFRIREDLLAALGNEIAVGMPGSQFLGNGRARRRANDASSPPPSGPIVVVALNDKESLQKLLPRVLNALGLAGATEQSIVEKHGQVEVLTFSNGTLAFIDRFLVGAPDAATMRRVTDAYNSGETLANSARFRDATSWQSRQAVGQVYASNAMLKGMFRELADSINDIEDPAMRAYLTRLDPDPGAITHLATRESDGLMHELRLPKNLLSLFTASEVVGPQLSIIRANEAGAQWKLQQMHGMQQRFKLRKGHYGTLEELQAAGFVNSLHAPLTVDGYEIKLNASGDKFEITATPTGYPKHGRRSFYMDQTGSLRGGDTGGKPATESTPIIE